MNRPLASAAFALLLLSPVAMACGEGGFNMGQGLRYQAYLAPRPAVLLVYADPTTSRQQQTLYRGLQKAGHKLTLVNTPEALGQAMRERRYDVAIARFSQVDALATQARLAGAQPRLLPMAARGEQIAPQLRERFRLYLQDGASLGQYLKVINQLLPVATK